MNVVTIERKILAKNDELAGLNRARFASDDIFVINMVSSPGSGKTSILERTLEQLRNNISIAVIEGDVQTDLDARRLSKYNVPTVQIVTRGGCHLEANLINEALNNLDLSSIQVLIIENVGNLVCPANYDLGEAMKIVVISVTEGDDKPLKYPNIFLHAAVLIINKIDLLPYVPCNLQQLRQHALSINPNLKVFTTSCTTGEGINEWCEWLLQQTRHNS